MESNLTLAQLAPFGLNEYQRKNLLADQKHFADTYLGGPNSNVVGVAIARNPMPNSQSDSVALLVHLKKDEPNASALYGDRSASGVKIIYQVTGEIQFLQRAHEIACAEEDAALLASAFTERSRPVLGGCSVSPEKKNYSGTAGCVVTSQGNDYMLSNNHVLAFFNTVPKDTPIIQPGGGDSGKATDNVAKLKAYVPLVVAEGTSPVENVADAAIALYGASDIYSAKLKKTATENYNLAGPVAAPVHDTPVQKSGRTTGYTTGKITAVNGIHSVTYDGKQYKFKEVIQITSDSSAPFSSPGDSGSVISTVAGNHPVGLLFAGNGGTTYANCMSSVLTALKAANGGTHDFTIKYTDPS